MHLVTSKCIYCGKDFGKISGRFCCDACKEKESMEQRVTRLIRENSIYGLHYNPAIDIATAEVYTNGYKQSELYKYLGNKNDAFGPSMLKKVLNRVE